MNVDVFEHMLDIVKLFVMLALTLQARNFFLLRTIRVSNYGTQKLVGIETLNRKLFHLYN